MTILDLNKLKNHPPLFTTDVSCGLFGIADDFVDEYLSLDEKFVKNKESCFFVRAQGDSMAPYILPRDILIVDRSVELFDKAVATFFFNSNATCKQYIKQNGIYYLRSFNKSHADIPITEDDQLDLFGVVTGIARSL